MSTTAKMARYKLQLASLAAHKAGAGQAGRTSGTPASCLRPRDLIRIRRRCQITGRSRGNLAKFGVCRIIFRDMASSGLIPGVRKASW